jgi:hypothetical protein
VLDTIINDLSSLARDRPPVLVAQILVGIEITLDVPFLWPTAGDADVRRVARLPVHRKGAVRDLRSTGSACRSHSSILQASEEPVPAGNRPPLRTHRSLGHIKGIAMHRSLISTAPALTFLGLLLAMPTSATSATFDIGNSDGTTESVLTLSIQQFAGWFSENDRSALGGLAITGPRSVSLFNFIVTAAPSLPESGADPRSWIDDVFLDLDWLP